ncbi:MAG TPA: hypothetical protein DCS88_08380, partial [Alphaproteobacteria bacterium]|nr:hypothetical protein [Alphaproteobacteria bacterium]
KCDCPAPDLLYPVILYIAGTYENVSDVAVQELIRTTHPEKEAKMISQFAQEILSDNPPAWVVDMVRQEARMMSPFAQKILSKARAMDSVRQEGRKEEAAAAILLRQLHRRFGKCSDLIAAKVNAADVKLLGIWSDRILDAKSVEDVFSE